MLHAFSLLATLIIFLTPAASASAAEAPLLKTPHFSFYTHGDVKLPAIQLMSEKLESAIERIGDDLNTVPADNIEVHVYAEQWRYALATGNMHASGSIEGAAKLHFVQQTKKLGYKQDVVLHEFSHAVTLKLLLDRAPTPLDRKAFDDAFKKFPVWLWESLAVYEAGDLTDPKTLRYLKNGEFPKLDELSNRSKGSKVYEVGYTIVEYILQRYGKDKLLQLIASHGDLQSTLKLSDAEFSTEWQRFVQAKYLTGAVE